MSSFLNSLAESGTDARNEGDIIHKHLPLKVFSGHKDEGYAIDWSPLVTGRLVSGVFPTISIFFYFSAKKCLCIQLPLLVFKSSIHLIS
jgi:hypothetical protein